MPSDIRLTKEHDIDISNSNIEIIEENTEIVAQRLKIALLLRASEWAFDLSAGVPYLQFGKTKGNKAYADSVIKNEALKVEGVENIYSYSSTLNNRVLEVSISVTTTGGRIVALALEV